MTVDAFCLVRLCWLVSGSISGHGFVPRNDLKLCKYLMRAKNRGQDKSPLPEKGYSNDLIDFFLKYAISRRLSSTQGAGDGGCLGAGAGTRNERKARNERKE